MNSIDKQHKDDNTESSFVKDNLPLLSFFRECGTRLGNILTGATDPRSVIFADGSFTKLTQVYQDTPQSKYYNSILTSTLKGLIGALPLNSKLRILEVGAGTGSTTSALLANLPADKTNYTFTDISDLFLTRAAERFTAYSFIDYRTLNLNHDVLAQGFEEAEFDIIIGANVLHTTPDIRASLSAIKTLLAPYGILLLREITSHTPLLGFEITFGPLLGPVKDTELRGDHPFLSAQGWQNLLREEGFDRVRSFPEEDAGEEHIIAGRYLPAATNPETRTAFSQPNIPAGVIPEVTGNTARHPLLGSEMISPLATVQFQNLISCSRQRFLKHHRVFEMVVVPGTAHFETAAAAGRVFFERDDVILENVQLREALILPEEKKRLLQVVLEPQGDLAEFNIFTTDSSEDGRIRRNSEWHLHATGMVRPAGSVSQQLPSLEHIKGLCTTEIDVEEYYAGFSSFGAVQYAGPFLGIKRLWKAEGEALGKVELEQRFSTAEEKFGIHPALLDSCLQCMVAAAISGTDDLQDGTGFMPFNAEKIHFYKAAPNIVWCHARAGEDCSFKDEFFSADFSIMTPEGELVARIENLHMKKTSKETLERLKMSQQPITELLYEVAWKQAEKMEEREQTNSGDWLLFADEQTNTAAALARKIIRSGQKATLVYPDKTGNTADGFSSDSTCEDILNSWLDSAENPKGIGFFRGLDNALLSPGDVDGFCNYTKQTCGSVLELVQAIAAANVSPPRLCLVTRGSQRIQEKEIPLILPETIWGLQKSIANEHPELNPLVVDLDPGCANHEDIDLLFELMDSRHSPEDKVAIRQQRIMVPRLVPGSIETGQPKPSTTGKTVSETASSKLKENETYRVTVPQPGVENICLAPLQRTQPGTGEIEIAVEAVGMNFRDIMLAMGLQPSLTVTFGTDCAGRVVALGPDVDNFMIGDRVFATAYGSLASHVITPSQSAALIPRGLDFAGAATIPTAFMTAWYALSDEGRMKKGDKILLQSAAGGVGLAAIQVAHALGAEIYATAGSEPKRALLRSMGVDHVYSSRTDHFKQSILDATGGRGVDMVLNFLTGPLIDAGLEVLTEGGRFLEIGKTDIRNKAEVEARYPKVSYRVIDLERMGIEEGEKLTEVFQTVMEKFNEGLFQPLPQRVFSFGEISEAFRYMLEARHVGKVVVVKKPIPAHREKLRREASYLITGGLSPLGLALARDLVEQGAQQLLLAGRHLPRGEAEKDIASLREKGIDVETIQLDVTDKSALTSFWSTLDKYQPLAGVFHLAGLLDDDTLVNLDWQRFEAVLAPKDIGALLLHDLTREMELDYFVLFSSMASIFGTHGQANHVVANSFLDALARHRQADFLPALSINWGAWGEIGSVARLGIEDRIAAQGVKTFHPGRALNILRQLLPGTAANVAVMDIDWEKMKNSLSLSSGRSFFSEIQKGKQTVSVPDQKTGGDDQLRKKFQQLPFTERVEAIQKYLCREIADFLHLNETDIPVDEDLVQLGMDSLISLDLFQRISRDLQIHIAPHEVLSSPYVAAMAQKFAGDIAPESAQSPPTAETHNEKTKEKRAHTIEKEDDAFQPFPLSDMQQAYWVGRNSSLTLSQVGCHFYLEAESDDLDIERYEEAWRRLIDRHPALRTIILDNGTQQVLKEVDPFVITIEDLEELSREQQLKRLEEKRRQLSHRLLDVSSWPPFHIEITRHDNGRLRTHFNFDLIICDFHGISIFMEELTALYNEPDLELVPLDYTFREYRLAEEKYRHSEEYAKAGKYWMQRLSSLPGGPELPLAQKPEDLKQTVFTRKMQLIDPHIWETLKKKALDAGYNATGVILTAFAQIIGFWSSSMTFSLNLTLFNRLPVHPQVDRIIGEFTSNNLLEIDLTKADDFKGQIDRIWKQLWTDMEHRAFSGVRVLRERARRSGSTEYVIPVVFTSTLGLSSSGKRSFQLGCMGTELYSVSQTPQVWLDHQVFEVDDRLLLIWDVVEDLFPSGMIDEMFAAYIDLLNRLADSDELWSDVSVVSLPSKQAEIRRAVNDTRTTLPGGLLFSRFLEKVAEQPDAPAVHTPDCTLSYRELGEMSATLADELNRRNLAATNVAILMEKGWEQIVAVLGILRAGAAYLPIPSDLPELRQRILLTDCGVSTVLSQSHGPDWLEQAPEFDVLVVDRLKSSSPQKEREQGHPDDLAYIIYTSGSTGTPKGVMISHRAAVNTIQDINRRFEVGPGDRVLAVSDLGFDLSVYDIFGLLSAGGTLVLPEHQRNREPAHWLELIAKYQVTIWNTVPALGQLLAEELESSRQKKTLPLRLAMFSGDWIPMNLVDRLQEFAPQLQGIGMGGATEASIWSNFHLIDPRSLDSSWKSIPYGKPLANQGFRVLDCRHNDRPDWVTGDLYISGSGLAMGYWHDDEKTKASFITLKPDNKRLYKTGDLARYRPDGTLEFLGRKDTQIKLNGYRVELGEIETHLQQIDGISDVAVIARKRGAAVSGLNAYIVTTDGRNPLITEEKADNSVSREMDKAIEVIQNKLDDGQFGGLDSDLFLPAWKHLNELYCGAVLSAFSNMELLDGTCRTSDDFLQKGGIADRYTRWVQRAIHCLKERGFIVSSGDNGGYLAGDYLPDTEHLLKETLASSDELGFSREESELLVRTVRELPDLLREEVHSAELYATEELPGLYQKIFSQANRVLPQLVKAIVDTLPEHRTLRILETGAGYGTSTRHILPVLPAEKTSYVFTDISRFFLTGARQRFKEYPFVHFALLDLDEDPQVQGYDAHNYDLIIAVNVLHDVQHIDRSLHSLHQLLGPGGHLLLLEETTFHHAFDLTMGLQQGFDRAADEDLRPVHPLLSRSQWQKHLAATGFEKVHLLTAQASMEKELGIDIIVARGTHEVFSFNEEIVVQYLRRHLPTYMIPSSFIKLDAIPLNNSGKVDRKLLSELTSRGDSTPDSTAKPSNDTERKLAVIWCSLLELEQIGIHTTFFAAGGDSLLAFQLVNAINGQFGVNMTLQDLFNAQTIARQAQRILGMIKAVDFSPVLCLHKGNANRPIFFIHPIEGLVFPYMKLAEKLGDRPFYGVQSHGFGNTGELPGSVPEMARGYLQSMQNTPDWEHALLGGWSMGAFIAWEMAGLRYRETGEKQTVFLLDPPAKNEWDELYSKQRNNFVGLMQMVADDPEKALTDSGITLKNMAGFSFEKQFAIFWDSLYKTGQAPFGDFSDEQTRLLVSVLQHNFEALHQYQPARQEGVDMVYIEARDQVANTRVAFWKGLAAEDFQHHVVPGNHWNMLTREENAGELAKLLRNRLDFMQQ